MAGEKYIVATAENPIQIAVRNILNPCGYTFLGNCSDLISLMRLIRSYHPDFIIVDMNMQIGELRSVLETVDEELLCACVIIGEYKDLETSNFIGKAKTIFFCTKPLNKEILVQIVEMSNLSYKRVYELNKKLREMTDNYEARKQIERAKWMLMEHDRLTESQAYEKLRNKSMNSRMSMKSIAEAIIFTYDIIGKKEQ